MKCQMKVHEENLVSNHILVKCSCTREKGGGGITLVYSKGYFFQTFPSVDKGNTSQFMSVVLQLMEMEGALNFNLPHVSHQGKILLKKTITIHNNAI